MEWEENPNSNAYIRTGLAASYFDDDKANYATKRCVIKSVSLFSLRVSLLKKKVSFLQWPLRLLVLNNNRFRVIGKVHFSVSSRLRGLNAQT